MIKYDFSANLKQFDGAEITTAKMSTILANAIGADSKVLSPRKALIWGVSLEQNGYIEIDDVDRKTLISFLENNENLPNITKGQFLEILDKTDSNQG